MLIESRIQIENFSGKTVHSIYQDFYAKMFVKNFAAVLIRSVDDRIESITPGRRYIYKANFTNVVAMIRHHIVVFFNRSKNLSPDYVPNFQNVIGRVLSEIRPGQRKAKIFKKKS